MNFLLPSPLSSPSTALQLFSPGGPGSARRDQRRSSRTPAFPDLSFSPFFARSGNPAAPQVHHLAMSPQAHYYCISGTSQCGPMLSCHADHRLTRRFR